MTREQIVTAARSYLGVKWVHEGRTRAGLDCIGLVCAVGTDLGVQFEDMKGYERTPKGYEFLNHLLKYLPQTRTNRPKPGSVAVIRQSRFPCHVGIFSGNNSGQTTLIHSYVPRHKVVEERFTASEPQFGLVMVLDYPGVTD